MSLKQELKENFELEKKRLGFKSEFKEIDEVFYISDMVESNKFVSDYLSRAICLRICETFSSWGNFCHRLIMPNPSSIPDISESKLLSKEDKEFLESTLKRIMEFSTRNTLIGLNKDTQAEAKFIDETLEYYNQELKPKASEIIKKLNNYWNTKQEKKEKFDYLGVS